MRKGKIINFSEAKVKRELRYQKYVGKISIVMTSKKVCKIDISEDVILDNMLELLKIIYSDMSTVKQKATKEIVEKKLTILLYKSGIDNKVLYYELDAITKEEAKSILHNAITYLNGVNKKG